MKIRFKPSTQVWKVVGVILLVSGLQLYGQQTAFTTFDVPGAGTGFGQGTFPTAINLAGAITGYYVITDNNGNYIPHGFQRAPDGTFTPFDPPGPLFYQQQIYPQAINPVGAITGIFEDAMFLFHGFLRAPDGTFISFDPAGSTYTQPYGINPAGAITGYYFDPSGAHGFLRRP